MKSAKQTRSIYLAIVVLILSILACGSSGEEEAAVENSEAVTEREETSEEADVPEPTDEPAPEPTSEEADVALGAKVSSDEGGFSFSEVPSWSVNAFFGITSLAPADAHEEYGPNIILIGGLDEENFSLQEAFDTFLSEFTADEENELDISAPYDTTVAGVPALSADISGLSDDGNTQILGRITIAKVNDFQSLVAFGFAPMTDWDTEVSAIYEAVLGSVSFFEPVVEIMDEEVMEETTDETTTEMTGETIRQWASSAFASSQYGDNSWSANQATGEPDTPDCGDQVTAWASATSSGLDWLELSFDIPVYATELNIYESNSPDQVTKVELIATDGSEHLVYTSEPVVEEDCPLILSLALDGDILVQSVRITVDQTLMSWTEIDAVELVGMTSDAGTTGSEAAAVVDFETPAGFLWRVGGESGIGDGQFSALGSMDVDSNGFLYVTDNIHGIWIYSPDGELHENIDHDEFNNVLDISVAANGNMVVTSWGNNSIFVMDASGTILTQFGGEGNGPGEFGTFSPSSVTVDLQNNIYVLDENEDDSGEEFDRIQVFDIDGTYQYEWVIEEEFFGPVAIQYWSAPNPADDRIYVLGFLGDIILEYDLNGNYIRSIGGEVLSFTGPTDFDIDAEGNFYVLLWTPAGVMKLDHDGNLVDQWGVEVEDDNAGLPEGGFYLPDGIAVHPDGGQVYTSEWTGDFAYVTAFTFE